MAQRGGCGTSAGVRQFGGQAVQASWRGSAATRAGQAKTAQAHDPPAGPRCQTPPSLGMLASRFARTRWCRRGVKGGRQRNPVRTRCCCLPDPVRCSHAWIDECCCQGTVGVQPAARFERRWGREQCGPSPQGPGLVAHAVTVMMCGWSAGPKPPVAACFTRASASLPLIATSTGRSSSS